MTSKLDRIQENANKYIVKNCTSLDSDGTTCQDCSYEDCGADDCINRTDCVIKQVIEKCKGNKEYALEYLGHRDMLAEEILQLFDIEEINE